MRWARRHWLEIALAVLLALPWLSILGLGFLWLWQSGRVLEWALAAALLGLITWPLRLLARRRARERMAELIAGKDFPELGWNTEEAEAWVKILRFAESATPLDFDDRARAEALTWDTIEVVARHFHPTQTDPMARVTLPEALLLTEQVAQRLRRWVVKLPGASRVRISDALWLQRMMERYGPGARTVYDVGQTIYRLGRLINPIQAGAQELQRLAVGTTGSLLGGNMRQKVTTQLIHETGRAAIDLYSGRMRLSSMEMAELARADAAAATPEAPPRLLLVGQAGAGKTSLLNALAGVARGHVSAVPGNGDVREHLVEVEGRPALNIADMPPLADPARFLEEAERADMILWVASATQPGRAPDAAALEALRGWAGGQRRNRPPPVLVALTHCDRLRPAAEWSPPYDPDRPVGAKALSMQAAREAVANLLSLPPESLIPVALPEGQAAWNVENLWARLSAELHSARLARHERLMEAGSAFSWRGEARKTLNTGRGFLKSMLRRR